GQVAVGADGVSPAVAVVVAGGEVAQVLHLHGSVAAGRPDQRAQDVVAFGVDIGVDAVGDLQGEPGQAHRTVVGAGGEPVHPFPAGQAPAGWAGPEAHVVALSGVALHLLLVGEGLPLPE